MKKYEEKCMCEPLTHLTAQPDHIRKHEKSDIARGISSHVSEVKNHPHFTTEMADWEIKKSSFFNLIP